MTSHCWFDYCHFAATLCSMWQKSVKYISSNSKLFLFFMDTVFIRLLATLDRKPYEMVLKMNVSRF